MQPDSLAPRSFFRGNYNGGIPGLEPRVQHTIDDEHWEDSPGFEQGDQDDPIDNDYLEPGENAEGYNLYNDAWSQGPSDAGSSNISSLPPLPCNDGVVGDYDDVVEKGVAVYPAFARKHVNQGPVWGIPPTVPEVSSNGSFRSSCQQHYFKQPLPAPARQQQQQQRARHARMPTIPKVQPQSLKPLRGNPFVRRGSVTNNANRGGDAGILGDGVSGGPGNFKACDAPKKTQPAEQKQQYRQEPRQQEAKRIGPAPAALNHKETKNVTPHKSSNKPPCTRPEQVAASCPDRDQKKQQMQQQQQYQKKQQHQLEAALSGINARIAQLAQAVMAQQLQAQVQPTPTQAEPPVSLIADCQIPSQPQSACAAPANQWNVVGPSANAFLAQQPSPFGVGGNRTGCGDVMPPGCLARPGSDSSTVNDPDAWWGQFVSDSLGYVKLAYEQRMAWGVSKLVLRGGAGAFFHPVAFEDNTSFETMGASLASTIRQHIVATATSNRSVKRPMSLDDPYSPLGPFAGWLLHGDTEGENKTHCAGRHLPDALNPTRESPCLAETRVAALDAIAALRAARCDSAALGEIAREAANTMCAMLEVPVKEAVLCAQYRAFTRASALRNLCRIPARLWWVCGCTESGVAIACNEYASKAAALEERFAGLQIAIAQEFVRQDTCAGDQVIDATPARHHQGMDFLRHAYGGSTTDSTNCAVATKNNKNGDNNDKDDTGVRINPFFKSKQLGFDEPHGSDLSAMDRKAKAMEAACREETRATLGEIEREGRNAMRRELQKACEVWGCSQDEAERLWTDKSRKYALERRTATRMLERYEAKMITQHECAPLINILRNFGTLFSLYAQQVKECSDSADVQIAAHQALFLWECVLTQIP